MRSQLNQQLDEPKRQYPLVPFLEWLLSAELARGESRELTLCVGNRTERDGGPWVRLEWTSADGNGQAGV